ncbi:MAG: GIY-YIG nuclease family protein [Candidatus Omnitrophica bacterium]|nr:GIY-YIG nuclease family protein [Candidatus Omnitrophota bacterium]
MFFVYVLRSMVDKKLYVGSTGSLEERLAAHNGGNVLSTKRRRPLELIYYEAYLDKRDATGRELFLKSGSGHRFLQKQLKHYLEDNLRGVEQPGSSLGS